MSSSLREALDAEARGIPSLGDIDAALADVSRSERRRRTVVAAVSGLVAAAVVVWASGLGPRSTDGAPVAPVPSGPPVVTVENQPLDLARSPLASGADAMIGTTAIAGTEQRSTITSFRIYSLALSPDGRYLAWSGMGSAGRDQLHIRDLTTADEVFSEQIVAASGGGGQTPRMEWSGDSRTLAVVLFETARADDGPALEVQLVVRGSDGAFAASGKPQPLPGPWVGIDATGARLYAESSGTLVSRYVVGRGSWGPVLDAPAWPAGADTAAAHVQQWYGQGVHRVSPDGRRVAWVQRHIDAGAPESLVGWITPETGQWTTFGVTGGDVSCAGWLGDELLVVVRGETATDLVAVAPDGAQRVLVTYSSWLRRSGVGPLLVATDRLTG